MAGTERPRSLSFSIPGRIGGKGRARSFLRKGVIAHSTPKKTASDEAVVRQFAHLAIVGAPLLQGPLRLEVIVYRMIPKSWSGKRRAAAIWITGKPDCDNVLKLIADAMNGIAYQDDSQIAALAMVRLYGIPECVGVTLTELGGI